MPRWPRCWKSASTTSSTRSYGDQPGDLIYFQGHASPGIYARAFLEGRLTEEHLKNFRHELREHPGLSSYPHPWLMPDFWQFPTVSMGLGPINAIYQARFMRYLENRGIIPTTPRKVWAFLGDGEMDEPESLGALTLASREKLDNLIFVINCNLQRLDGPVRGNGKIIQELEARLPRRRLERHQGHLGRGLGSAAWRATPPACCMKRMDEVRGRRVPDLHQPRTARTSARTSSASIRSCSSWSTHLSDEQICKLRRGGHDPQKVYNAYKRRVETQGQPDGDPGQDRQGLRPGRSRRRPQHHPPAEEAQRRRDRALPLALRDSDPRRSGARTPRSTGRRGQPGDAVPARAPRGAGRLSCRRARCRKHRRSRRPPLEYFKESLEGSGGREVSTHHGVRPHPDACC